MNTDEKLHTDYEFNKMMAHEDEDKALEWLGDNIKKYKNKIDIPDAENKTPLMRAVIAGHLKVVKALVEKHGANVHETAGGRVGAVSYAALYGHHDIFMYLHDEKDARGVRYALVHAVMGRSLVTAIHLLHHNPDVDIDQLCHVRVDEKQLYTTALLLACREGLLEFVELFIRYNASFSDIGYGHPLGLASEEGHWEIVKYLLEVKAYNNSELNETQIIVNNDYELKNIRKEDQAIFKEIKSLLNDITNEKKQKKRRKATFAEQRDATDTNAEELDKRTYEKFKRGLAKRLARTESSGRRGRIKEEESTPESDTPDTGEQQGQGTSAPANIPAGTQLGDSKLTRPKANRPKLFGKKPPNKR